MAINTITDKAKEKPILTERIRRPYCLRCYSPIERTSRVSVKCERCNFVNVTADQREYWTKEAQLIRLERAGKVAVLGVLLAIGYVMFALPRMQFGMGQGFGVGFPIVVGVVLWKTVEKATHRSPYFRPAIFWGTLPLIPAFPLFVGSLWPDDDIALIGRVIGLAVVAVFAGIGLCAYRLCRRLARWRDDRILTAQSAACPSEN